MAGSGQPDWEGLLKWSLAQQKDGDSSGPSRQLTEEERKWFMEAVQGQTVDIVKRMKEITMVMSMPEQTLEQQGVSVSEIEGMLEELQEHVEGIDFANDLNAIGGLPPLLAYLKSPHASLRARAAEVVSTVVQNNPRGQQAVMDAHGLEYLLTILSTDPDLTARSKALGAISSLIRQNKVGLDAFRLANGYSALKDGLQSPEPRLQRKSLQVLQYLIQESPGDPTMVGDLNLPRNIVHLVASSDADVRTAALSALLEIASNGPEAVKTLTAGEVQLKGALTERVDEIGALRGEDDLAAIREERQSIDVLWQSCFKEPSPLRAAGLVVTEADNGEGLPPNIDLPRRRSRLDALPDLSGGGGGGGGGANGEANGEAKKPVLLLGPGPASGGGT